MPSPFDAIDAAMQAAIDHRFGEGIRIVPMVGDTNYSGGPDPARPVRDGVRATVARAPKAGATDYSGSQRNGASFAAMPAELWIDRAAYAAVGYKITRGDEIVLTDDAGAPSFTVASVHEGDNGDVAIILG
jgi:hypothetical protein